MPKQIYLYSASGQESDIPAGDWGAVHWDADLDHTGGTSLVLPEAAKLWVTTVWLYTAGLTRDDNLYVRMQTLDRDGNQLALYPIAELRATSGDSSLAYTQVGSSNPATNLRVLVSGTRAGTVTKAWWRTFYW